MLNMDGIGQPLVKIKGGKNDGKIIHVEPEENKKIKKRFNKYELGENEEFVPIANWKNNRNVMYTAGRSGSGKTYYTKQYVKELLTKKKKPVYLFSPFDEDESLDEIDPQRIKIDIELYNDPIDCKELKNSIVIFDDIDSIKIKPKKDEKLVKEAIRDLIHQCLKIGRHYDIDIVQTNHILCDNHNTKDILNEAHSITFFPHSGSKSQMLRLCEEYGGIDSKAFKDVKKIKTRWCTIHRNFPIIISTQKKVFYPDAEEEENKNKI